MERAQSARRFPRAATMLDIYSRTVNAQTPLSEVLAEFFPWCEEHHEALAEIYRAYGARKRTLGVLDLDDLLLYWRALAADPVTGPLIAAEYEHVLVDEYQDVNGLQVEIVRDMRTTQPGLTVVGDDFQAIYGFRSASARHILEFPQQFAGAQTAKLERNYRSTAAILAVANAVSAQDRERVSEDALDRARRWRSARTVVPRDEAEQARAVCDSVMRGTRGGDGAARAGGAVPHQSRLCDCSRSSLRAGEFRT